MSEISDRLTSGVLAAGELGRLLGVSRATLMRRLRSEGQAVVRFGRGPATRYGLRRDVRGLGSDLPAFRIDADGQPHAIGSLVVLAGDQTGWMPGGVVYDGLPPEVAAMRPSGFMGRAFPRQHADLGLPPRVMDWSDDHILIAVARRGEDLAGDLVVGDESMERWFSSRPIAVPRSQYPERAAAATQGDPPGSSAGGERPKFGAYTEGRHVLVKFAAHGGPVGERWRDLLILESLALNALEEGGAAASEARLIESSDHTFLEVVRFDRIGERGRRAAMTLAALDYDPSISWARLASTLSADGILSEADAQRLKLYDAFAQLIANTDRHHRNVAVFPDFVRDTTSQSVVPMRCTLAPAFDQLPMLYAPTADGQLPERTFTYPSPRAENWDVWQRAETVARAFWQRAGEDDRLSASMQRIVAHHLSLAR